MQAANLNREDGADAVGSNRPSWRLAGGDGRDAFRRARSLQRFNGDVQVTKAGRMAGEFAGSPLPIAGFVGEVEWVPHRERRPGI
ncbi:hypothetical protein CCR95_06470 [Thiocystis minor]|nr:hypothetical protein [Thiocystis minor]